MHGKEQESIEDMMEEIINKSLAFQEWSVTSKCMTYTLHDLQLDFLTENYKDKLEVRETFFFASKGKLWSLFFLFCRKHLCKNLCKLF